MTTDSRADPHVCSWWVLFPFSGIEIADATAGLEEPSFGDSAIFSKILLPDVWAPLKLNEGAPPGRGNEEFFLKCMAYLSKVDVDSILAVRRSGPKPQQSREPDEHLFVDGAARRAYEVSALICLTMLAFEQSRQPCGLSEQTHHPCSGSVTAIQLEERGFIFQTRQHATFSADGESTSTKIRRDELVRFLEHEDMRRLRDVIVPQRPSIPRSLRNVITQAAIRLADAIHSLTRAAQLLGAVTSMEMLLSGDECENYKITSERITSLIGHEEADRFDLAGILGARHRYVHRGDDVGTDSLVRNAIALALLTLVRFAALAVTLPDRNALVRYLDFLRQSEEFSSHLRDRDRTAIARLVRHSRERSSLPFFGAQSEGDAS